VLVDRGAIANVMWGTDFPHFEGMWPHTKPRLHELVCCVPETRARALLGGDLARAYGIDIDAIGDLVERIGPRPSDLALGP
jgi:hypothetical protein